MRENFNFQLIFRTSPDEPIRGKQSVVSFCNFYAFNLLLNHRKFLICFALHFLASLSYNLSYMLYRKFPVMFCAVFFG